MTDKDDEIISLLRQLVVLGEENKSRYADAVKQNQALLARNRTIVFSGALLMVVAALRTLHFRWLP
jgi:hypothetical protein